jgi:hypothetical protein
MRTVFAKYYNSSETNFQLEILKIFKLYTIRITQNINILRVEIEKLINMCVFKIHLIFNKDT